MVGRERHTDREIEKERKREIVCEREAEGKIQIERLHVRDCVCVRVCLRETLEVGWGGGSSGHINQSDSRKVFARYMTKVDI